MSHPSSSSGPGRAHRHVVFRDRRLMEEQEVSRITAKAAEAETTDSGAASSSASSSSSPSPTSLPKSPSSVSLDDFEILRVLGKGAYGKVFQARKTSGRDAGEVYALKSVSKARIGGSRTDVRHTRTERDVLVRVRHPFLVRVRYAFETSHRLYFAQVS